MNDITQCSQFRANSDKFYEIIRFQIFSFILSVFVVVVFVNL